MWAMMTFPAIVAMTLTTLSVGRGAPVSDNVLRDHNGDEILDSDGFYILDSFV